MKMKMENGKKAKMLKYKKYNFEIQHFTRFR